jgi:serine/threonine-protein phosphatase 2B catalytic subunit
MSGKGEQSPAEEIEPKPKRLPIGRARMGAKAAGKAAGRRHTINDSNPVLEVLRGAALSAEKGFPEVAPPSPKAVRRGELAEDNSDAHSVFPDSDSEEEGGPQLRQQFPQEDDRVLTSVQAPNWHTLGLADIFADVPRPVFQASPRDSPRNSPKVGRRASPEVAEARPRSVQRGVTSPLLPMAVSTSSSLIEDNRDSVPNDGISLSDSAPPVPPRPDAGGPVHVPGEPSKCRTRRIRRHFEREGRLDPAAAQELLRRARLLLAKEPNVLETEAPITIVGDLHGQFFDLVHMLGKAGEPGPDNRYLFLGDFVDRGCFSTEVLLYLCALKLTFPHDVLMLRGNHECRLLAEKYNFRAEVLAKYNKDVFEEFVLLFQALPLAAVVNTEKMGRFFAVHGGISPDTPTIADIDKLDRFAEPERRGALCDLLWSDPLDDALAQQLRDDEMGEWFDLAFEDNPDRGCSFVFGHKAAAEFLERNGMTSIIRAHEVQREGYLEHYFLCHKEGDPLPEGGDKHIAHRFDVASRTHPLVITVFSAPNYCDMYHNQAAYLRLEHAAFNFSQTEWVEHPFQLPDFQNAFSYSLPHVVEHVSNFAKFIWEQMGVNDRKEERLENEEATPAEQRKKLEKLRGHAAFAYARAHIRRELQEANLAQEQSHLNMNFEEALKLDRAEEYRRPDPSDVAGRLLPRRRARSFYM